MKSRFVITGALLRLRRYGRDEDPEFNLEYGNIKKALEGKEVTLKTVREAIVAIRNAKLPDPRQMGNAGSFFKNPVVPIAIYETLRQAYPDMPSYDMDPKTKKIPAGWLIEHCGLKGYRMGGAAVYEKQCLVLVNADHAKPTDVVELCQHVVNCVEQKFGITIEPEVNIL